MFTSNTHVNVSAICHVSFSMPSSTCLALQLSNFCNVVTSPTSPILRFPYSYEVGYIFPRPMLNFPFFPAQCFPLLLSEFCIIFWGHFLLLFPILPSLNALLLSLKRGAILVNECILDLLFLRSTSPYFQTNFIFENWYT